MLSMVEVFKNVNEMLKTEKTRKKERSGQSVSFVKSCPLLVNTMIILLMGSEVVCIYSVAKLLFVFGVLG